MALLINNDVTARVLTIKAAVDAMERVLRQYAQGLAVFQPRTDIWSPTAIGGDYYRWGSLLGAMIQCVLDGSCRCGCSCARRGGVGPEAAKRRSATRGRIIKMKISGAA